VPEPHQQAAADTMEAAFSLPPTDPLAHEPSEPFDLIIWRGGAGKRTPNTVSVCVRAVTRRLADGTPVGLLLLQHDSRSNDEIKARTAADQEVLAVRQTLALREEELDAHEITLRAQRDELVGLYTQLGATPPEPEAAEPKAARSALSAKGSGGGGQEAKRRVSFSSTNRVAAFTRGSSPVEFGGRLQHEQLRAAVMPPGEFTPTEAKMKP